MDNIAYIGLSRQTTLQKQMDVIANNIANMDTAGFKVEQMLLNTQSGAPAKDDEVKGPPQFSMAGGLARDFSEGELTQTGRATDVAIDGNAFFTISTPQGNRYTKDGRFGIDATGRPGDRGRTPGARRFGRRDHARSRQRRTADLR